MNQTQLIKQSAVSLRHLELFDVGDHNVVVPSWCHVIEVWGCSGGGGGGGGHATGGGGGGGGGGAMVIGYLIPVAPGETLLATIPPGGSGGAVGADGTVGDKLFLRRGGTALLNVGRAQAGKAGQESVGGGGAGGPSDLYFAGGVGATNANGGRAGDLLTYGLNSGQFRCGSGGGGGVLSTNGNSYSGGASVPCLASSVYANGGSTGSSGGAGGAGGTCWPNAYPCIPGENAPGNGGNNSQAGFPATGYGHGGGGGGRGQPGGNGKQGFMIVYFK